METAEARNKRIVSVLVLIRGGAIVSESSTCLDARFRLSIEIIKKFQAVLLLPGPNIDPQ